MNAAGAELEALWAPQGVRAIKYRCDLIRNGVKFKEIPADGSISWSLDDEIGRTGRMTIYEEIDWLQDRLKPYMVLKVKDEVKRKALTVGEINALTLTVGEINAMKIKVGSLGPDIPAQWAEYPLGLLVPATPNKQMDDNGIVSWSVECYDGIIRLKQDCLTDLLYIPAGTNYISAVQSVLAGAGIENVIISDPTTLTLPIDREFDTGSTKLEVINTLLEEINYNKIRCDADGNFVLSRYREPSTSEVTVSYRADQYSIISQGVSVETDYFDTPNHWICVVSNPDQDQSYRADYINDDPDSPLSTVSRGVHIVKMVDGPEVAASQEEVEAYVAKVAFEEGQTFETVTFNTAAMPHDALEIVALSHPGVSGVYQETGWTISLESGQSMSHTARRVSFG